MPQPEPPVPATLVIIAVPSTFQENDPPSGSVWLPQVEPRLGSVVACDRSVAQVDPLQAPLLLEAVLLQNLDQLLNRVALDRSRAGGHRDGVPRLLLGGYRQHECRQAYRDLQIVEGSVLFFFITCFALFPFFFNGLAFVTIARDRICNELDEIYEPLLFWYRSLFTVVNNSAIIIIIFSNRCDRWKILEKIVICMDDRCG